MTTSGADVPAGINPVAWTTSTSPVTDSAFGQFSRVHPSYRNRRPSGSIATGAGVHVQEVNRLLNQFDQMQGMMKKMKGGGLMKMMKRMGGGGFPGMPR